MSDFASLIGGFKVFKATTYNEYKDAIKHIIRLGHKPRTLFITCSDLRISPNDIFSSNPGDFFIFSNIAAIVPLHDNEGAKGIIAAIEYAVIALKVESVVVLGHAKCDSIKLLMDSDNVSEDIARVKSSPAMQKWLSIADDAKNAVMTDLKDKSQEEKEHACEKEVILVSLRNLLTYPFIQDRLHDDLLKLYGWHFDIETGELLGFNPETRNFELIA